MTWTKSGQKTSAMKVNPAKPKYSLRSHYLEKLPLVVTKVATAAASDVTGIRASKLTLDKKVFLRPYRWMAKTPSFLFYKRILKVFYYGRNTLFAEIVGECFKCGRSLFIQTQCREEGPPPISLYKK